MKTYVLYREQILPVSIEEAWDFFSSPMNLERITPPDVRFKVHTPFPENASIYSGMRIEYEVRPLLNIPMHWETEILDVQKPYRFKDVQRQGPYAYWAHTHTFEDTPQGVLMTDLVEYVMPYSIVGRLAHVLIVKKKLNKIFDFRSQVLKKLFK